MGLTEWWWIKKKIHKLEVGSIEITQSENREKNKIEKIWKGFPRPVESVEPVEPVSNILTVEVTEGKEWENVTKILEEIMAGPFPNMMKDINLLI